MKKVIFKAVLPLIVASLLRIAVNPAAAQTGNIYLDGENYVTLKSTDFPSKIEWSDASTERIEKTASQFPVKTYWFSHNGKSYVVLNLTAGRNDIYIELGDNKSSYQFPAAFDHSRQQGTYNNFILYAENKAGGLQRLDVTGKDKLSVTILQLDSLHIKLSFNGTVIAHANTDKSELRVGPLTGAPITIAGRISLSKKSPGLTRLPDSYPGCNNVIYNEMSPDYSSGQFYTATACERSFYKKVFGLLSKSLAPAIEYLRSKDWDLSGVPTYKPLENRWRQDLNHYFRTNPNSGIDYDMAVTASPVKGDYQIFIQKIIKDAQLSARGDAAKAAELQALQKQEPRKFKLRLQVSFNQPVLTNHSLDFRQAVVRQLNDQAFLIEDVENTSSYTFQDDGGFYLFLGKWATPKLEEGYIKCSPELPPGDKKLSIQAMYIRIGCGRELATTLIKRLDMNLLKEILQATP